MLKINVNKVSKTRFSAHVKVSPEEKTVCDKKAFENIRSKVKIDGFRKGKVPEHIIKTRYSQDLEESSVQYMIDMASEQLIKETDKDIYKIRKVENLVPEKGGYSFELIFDIHPEINLGKMKGVTLKELIPIIDEADIKKETQEVLKIYSEKKLKNDDEAANVGDLIVLSYEQWVEGVPIAQPSENVQVNLGNFQFDKEIEEHLIAEQVKKGQEHRVSKKFIQDDGVEKKVDIIIHIDAIYNVSYPELTDEIAVKYDADYTSAKELKNDINKVLFSRFHRKNMDEEIGEALDKLNETTEIDFPENYTQEKLQKYMEENKTDLSAFEENEHEEFKLIFERELKKRLVNEFILKEALKDIKTDEYHFGFTKFIDDNFDKRMLRTFKIVYNSVMSQNDKNEYGNQFINRLLQIYHLDILERYFRDKGLVKKDKKVAFSEFMSQVKQ
ncbi:MAG: trigger factor [Spirochaetia bacterium]|nr:trigger factor [Spirochaetia bacterium]